jgi:hypothetical protein
MMARLELEEKEHDRSLPFWADRKGLINNWAGGRDEREVQSMFAKEEI